MEEACLISVVLYVSAARLGRGGMFDQCARLGGGGMFDQHVISVVTICRCCKTWWRHGMLLYV